jgi:hypothetical protein
MEAEVSVHTFQEALIEAIRCSFLEGRGRCHAQAHTVCSR